MANTDRKPARVLSNLLISEQYLLGIQVEEDNTFTHITAPKSWAMTVIVEDPKTNDFFTAEKSRISLEAGEGVKYTTHRDLKYVFGVHIPTPQESED